jgi:hypothetical protein
VLLLLPPIEDIALVIVGHDVPHVRIEDHIIHRSTEVFLRGLRMLLLRLLLLMLLLLLPLRLLHLRRRLLLSLLLRRLLPSSILGSSDNVLRGGRVEVVREERRLARGVLYPVGRRRYRRVRQQTIPSPPRTSRSSSSYSYSFSCFA